jgi:hypothetical protein
MYIGLAFFSCEKIATRNMYDFLQLRNCYHNGMFRIKVRKIVFYVRYFVQQFKDVDRTMEIYVQELIIKKIKQSRYRPGVAQRVPGS